MTNAGRLTGLLSALAIVGFFFPWILVSCAGNPEQQVTGYQIAHGFKSQTFLGPLDAVEPRPIVYISLIAPIVIYAIFAYNYIRNKSTLRTILLQSFLAVLGISPALGVLRQIQNKAESSFQTITPEYGLWVVLASYVGIIVTCMIDWMNLYREKQKIIDNPVQSKSPKL